MDIFSRSMHAPLRDVALRHPAQAFRSQHELSLNWKEFGYVSCPDFDQACKDFDQFAALFERAGCRVHFVEEDLDTGIDSLYVHDPAMTIGSGVVLGRMGKPLRDREVAAYESFCTRHGINVLGRIQSPGLLEAGDIVFLNEQTLAVAAGYRTNQEGIRQLGEITRGVVNEIIPVPLPHFRGPGDVLHLMSLISPIAENTAVVYRKFLSVPFLGTLNELNYNLIDIEEDEYDALACNVLAVTPDLAIMAEGSPKTKKKIEQAGIDVWTYPPEEISLKGLGGPTCLTQVLVRR